MSLINEESKMEHSIKSTLMVISESPSFTSVVGTMLFGENQPCDMLAMRASAQGDRQVRDKLLTLYKVQPQLFERNLRKHFTEEAEVMIAELQSLAAVH